MTSRADSIRRSWTGCNRVELSYKAEETGVVRFEVVEPPNGNEQPVSPDRPRLILVVLLGGLVGGFGVAYAHAPIATRIFTSARQLLAFTKLPVLGIVSMTWLERHRADARRAVWAYGLVVKCPGDSPRCWCWPSKT